MPSEYIDLCPQPCLSSSGSHSSHTDPLSWIQGRNRLDTPPRWADFAPRTKHCSHTSRQHYWQICAEIASELFPQSLKQSWICWPGHHDPRHVVSHSCHIDPEEDGLCWPEVEPANSQSGMLCNIPRTSGQCDTRTDGRRVQHTAILSIICQIFGKYSILTYFVIITVEYYLFILYFHHLNTLLYNMVSVVIFNVFLYPRFKFLLT